jgi:hypothetical protein
VITAGLVLSGLLLGWVLGRPRPQATRRPQPPPFSWPASIATALAIAFVGSWLVHAIIAFGSARP